MKDSQNYEAPALSSVRHLLGVLRQKMEQAQLNYYLIGSSDPHSDESVPDHWRYLAAVSGFTGSVGYLLVTQDFAGLWVDSRYHIQAERECPEEIQVLRMGMPGVPMLHEYMQECLRPVNSPVAKEPCLGFDDRCFSRSNLSKLLRACTNFACRVDGSSLGIDALWTDGRPSYPNTPVYSYKIEYCGQSRREKVAHVRKELQAYRYYPITLLDNIAWLLNIRASDIAFSPVAISYLLLGQQSLQWYIRAERLDPELRQELQQDLPELEILPYENFYADVQALAAQTLETCFLLSDRCNMRLLDIVEQGVRFSEQKKSQRALLRTRLDRDIITDLKAIKNPTEQEQLRQVMAIDGAAVVAFHEWLRPLHLPAKPHQEPCNEYLLGQKLTEFRSQIAGDLGRGESFSPIVGFGDNSTLNHYSATAEGSRALSRQGGGWLLVDSGGQYLGGTTDMTRCFSLEPDFTAPRLACGDTSSDQKLRHIYTLVLRGHLALQNARFPKGTLGIQLDTLARSPLWSENLNYQHGTGHGVGSFLNVHEGPASISPYPLDEVLKPGMLLSNEPGYYLEGAFGIRIENLLLVKEDPQNRNWLCFEPMTMFPYERELICIEELSEYERKWIDQYHLRCQQQILSCDKLNAAQEAWLRARCTPLKSQ